MPVNLTHLLVDRNNQPEFLLILKREIEQIFGRKIVTAAECIELAEEIYHKTSARINSNTLRRFFGLVKTEYLPSSSTKNILSEYCGFSSYDDLIGFKYRRESNKKMKDLNLFLRYQIRLFEELEIQDKEDPTFSGFLKHTIEYLNNNPEIAIDFQQVILRSTIGSEFYFERFINIDRLNSFFGDGLYYYIQQTILPEKKVFGYSLLCLRYWLASDKSQVAEKSNKIEEYELPAFAGEYIYGAYYAARLVHADFFNLHPEDIMIDAYNVHLRFKNNNDTKDAHQTFEYWYCFGLILAGHFEDALFYLDYLLSRYKGRNETAENYCQRNILLFKCLVMCKTNRKSEAEQLYCLLKPAQFCFLSKKVDTFFYLVISRCIRKSSESIDTQLAEVIEETGFYRLKQLI